MNKPLELARPFSTGGSGIQFSKFRIRLQPYNIDTSHIPSAQG